MQKYTEFLYIVYIAHRQTFPPPVFVHLDKKGQILNEKVNKSLPVFRRFTRIDIEKRLYIWYSNCIKINFIN